MKVHTHAVALFAESQRGDEYLLGIYDNTYPVIKYRGRAIGTSGGMVAGEDVSPFETLRRETLEEFSREQDYEDKFDPTLAAVTGPGSRPERIERFAEQGLIDEVRDALLRESKPFRDYLVHVPAVQEGRNPFDMVLSTYSATLPQDLIESIRAALERGEGIKNEGLSRLVSVQSLINGTPLTAWATGHVIRDLKEIGPPNPEGVTVENIGLPRASFAEYREFEYKCPIKGRS